MVYEKKIPLLIIGPCGRLFSQKSYSFFCVYVILGIILKAKVKLCYFLEKPEIVLEPTDVDVQFGTTAYLTCRAVGDPQPEIKWLHNKSVFTFLIIVAILFPFVHSSVAISVKLTYSSE